LILAIRKYKNDDNNDDTDNDDKLLILYILYYILISPLALEGTGSALDVDSI